MPLAHARAPARLIPRRGQQADRMPDGVCEGAWTEGGQRQASDDAADSLLQLLAIAAAQRQPRAVLQEHDVLAVEPRLQLA